MKLIEIINQIHKAEGFDDLMTVYAKKEWTPDSEAIITPHPYDGSIAPIGEYKYFLEVFIIKDWADELDFPEVTVEQCKRIIQYALNDA